MERSKSGPPQPASMDPVVLRMTVESGEPISGTLVVEGESESHAFRGWIELMAIVAAAQKGEHA